MTRADMRILIGSIAPKLALEKEFAAALSKLGVECRVVLDSDVYDGFPSRKVSSWFRTRRQIHRLFDEFKPHAVVENGQGHFGVATLDRHIPLFVHLIGDYWSNMAGARETLYRNPLMKPVPYLKDRMAGRCFAESTAILPICNHLKGIVERRYPGKPTATLYQGMDPARWKECDADSKGNMSLKHPCVGLIQVAEVWGKTLEMLTVLPKVVAALPDVTFYWAGDGPYRDKILHTLSKYENFEWLGSLRYPDAIKEYISEIDVYALISGLDMAPRTLLEAQLMQKPVLATSVGGIPELMQDEITGLLAEPQNPKDAIMKINELLRDEKRSREMGRRGRKFVETNFNWDKIAASFVRIAKPAIF